MPDQSAPQVPYGKGTASAPCDDCWEVPSRHCCMWNDDNHEEAD